MRSADISEEAVPKKKNSGKSDARTDDTNGEASNSKSGSRLDDFLSRHYNLCHNTVGGSRNSSFCRDWLFFFRDSLLILGQSLFQNRYGKDMDGCCAQYCRRNTEILFPGYLIDTSKTSGCKTRVEISRNEHKTITCYEAEEN